MCFHKIPALENEINSWMFTGMWVILISVKPFSVIKLTTILHLQSDDYFFSALIKEKSCKYLFFINTGN